MQKPPLRHRIVRQLCPDPGALRSSTRTWRRWWRARRCWRCGASPGTRSGWTRRRCHPRTSWPRAGTLRPAGPGSCAGCAADAPRHARARAPAGGARAAGPVPVVPAPVDLPRLRGSWPGLPRLRHTARRPHHVAAPAARVARGVRGNVTTLQRLACAWAWRALHFRLCSSTKQAGQHRRKRQRACAGTQCAETKDAATPCTSSSSSWPLLRPMPAPSAWRPAAAARPRAAPPSCAAATACACRARSTAVAPPARAARSAAPQRPPAPYTCSCRTRTRARRPRWSWYGPKLARIWRLLAELDRKREPALLVGQLGPATCGAWPCCCASWACPAPARPAARASRRRRCAASATERARLLLAAHQMRGLELPTARHVVFLHALVEERPVREQAVGCAQRAARGRRAAPPLPAAPHSRRRAVPGGLALFFCGPPLPHPYTMFGVCLPAAAAAAAVPLGAAGVRCARAWPGTRYLVHPPPPAPAGHAPAAPMVAPSIIV